MSGNEPRFETLYRQGVSWSIIRDRQTGVQYLAVGTGITPLLDKDGRPYAGDTHEA